jgi:hypothetical protein
MHRPFTLFCLSHAGLKGEDGILSQGFRHDVGCPNPPPNSGFFIGINWFGDIPDHQQASDARRQGATTEAYRPIRRKEVRTPALLGREGNAADDVPAKAGLMP